MRRLLPEHFARYWWAATISYLGDGVLLAGLPLLAATLTKDPLLIAGTQVALGLAWLVFGPFAGLVGDRINRRQLMVAVDIGRAAAIGILALSVLGGWVSLPLIYGVALLLGVGTVLFDPAAQAAIPNVVGADNIAQAGGAISASSSGARDLLGPAIGGIVFAFAAWAPFALDSVSFIISALLVVGLVGNFASGPRERAVSVRHDFVAGWRYLRQNRVLRLFAGFGAIGNFAAAGLEATFVVFAFRILHVGAAGYGLVLAGGAAGGVVAGLLTHRLIERFGTGTTNTASWLVAGVIAPIAAFCGQPVLCTLLLSVVFGGAVTGSIISFTLRQELTPDSMRARVGGLVLSIQMGGWAVGALVGGLLARGISPRAPLIFYGVVSLAVGVVTGITCGNGTIDDARSAVSPTST